MVLFAFTGIFFLVVVVTFTVYFMKERYDILFNHLYDHLNLDKPTEKYRKK